MGTIYQDDFEQTVRAAIDIVYYGFINLPDQNGNAILAVHALVQNVLRQFLDRDCNITDEVFHAFTYGLAGDIIKNQTHPAELGWRTLNWLRQVNNGDIMITIHTN